MCETEGKGDVRSIYSTIRYKYVELDGFPVSLRRNQSRTVPDAARVAETATRPGTAINKRAAAFIRKETPRWGSIRERSVTSDV